MKHLQHVIGDKLKFKIQSRIPGLCTTCREGLVAKQDDNQLMIICSVRAHPIRILKPILECTDYDDKRVPSKWDMEQIAWTLETDKKNVLGFKPPKKKE